MNNMVYISIGSNLGNRFANLQKAVSSLGQIVEKLEESIILETEALLQPNSPDHWNKPFLNMVIRGNVTRSPEEFLSILQNIEIILGRNIIRTKWSPRLVDLDILLWNGLVINRDNLSIPHMELLNRPFLLHLIAMMDRHLCYPETELTFGEIAHKAQAEKYIIRSFTLNPKFVAVVNITPDSFSDKNLYFNWERAIEQILHLSEACASIIEIGAQSTRPGALIIEQEEEWRRLEPVLDGILNHMKSGYDYTLSLDSFSPNIIRKALIRYNISWVNDVKGDLDSMTLEFINEKACSIIAVHSLNIPPDRHIVMDFNLSEMDLLLRWAEKTINKLMKHGFTKDRIILDPGIGFGKSLYQNLALLKNIKLLKQLECKILVGHSRKSYLGAITKARAHNRDLETIAISNELYHSNVDYLRVHDLVQHQRFFTAKRLCM